MSSSTSSSDPSPDPRSSRNEWKVVAALALTFLIAETGIRVFERDLSVDIAHIRDAANVAERIAGHQGGYDVLVLGNSSSRAGIDPELLTRRLEAAGHQDVRIHFFYPDGGNIGVWRWAWRRYFAPPRRQPDLVMICGGRSHFDDAELDPVISANHFVATHDAGPFLMRELHSTESRLEFLVAKLSMSFANRHRVQRRFLDLIMPYNREVLSEIADNAARQDTGGARAPGRDDSTRLLALLDDLRAAHTPAVVIALPSYEAYPVPPARISTVDDAGAHWIDLRVVSGLRREDYYDKAHVTHEGAAKLTTVLADELNKKLQR